MLARKSHNNSHKIALYKKKKMLPRESHNNSHKIALYKKKS